MMKAREIIDTLYEAHPSLRDSGMAALLARAEIAEAALANCQHDLGTMENKVDQAEAKLAERDKPCLWTVVSDYQRKYQSGCTSDWWDRKFLHCPDCGHEVVIEVGRRVAA